MSALKIGDMLYRIALCQEWNYEVIGIQTYANVTLYHIQCRNKGHGHNEMLVSVSTSGGGYSFAGYCGDPEDSEYDSDKHLHNDSARFWTSKAAALVAYHKEIIRGAEESARKFQDIADSHRKTVEKHKALLTATENALAETKRD